MSGSALTAQQRKSIKKMVAHYENNKHLLETFSNNIRSFLGNSPELGTLVHSMKWRLKDPDHLEEKLERKAKEAREKRVAFDYSVDNLFVRVNDLVGFRLLHLHTNQFERIDHLIRELLREARFELVEGPIARAWDSESRSYFERIGVECVDSKSMYTSVHYVIASNSKTKLTAELQVRTLAEELWGEVNHQVNYPHPTNVLPCVEQIKVLARLVSSCSRLVDSIFLSHAEGARHSPRRGKRRARRGRTVSRRAR
jgi:putative GTP pyrophosphokinase